MDKTFLIIDGIRIPDMERGALKIQKKDLSVYERMISGRLVCEKRGYIWTIQADFSEIDTGLMEALTEKLYSLESHMVTFLPPNGSTATITSEFYMTNSPELELDSWQNELPEWGGLSYFFEEIEPHE